MKDGHLHNVGNVTNMVATNVSWTHAGVIYNEHEGV